jgi:hypothetical protein
MVNPQRQLFTPALDVADQPAKDQAGTGAGTARRADSLARCLDVHLDKERLMFVEHLAATDLPSPC